jgi:hypothetical protein
MRKKHAYTHKEEALKKAKAYIHKKERESSIIDDKITSS